MRNSKQTRRLLTALSVASGAALLSGCVGGPTYGTGKTAGEQLVDDLSGITDILPRQRRALEYEPRAGIVLPPQDGSLPQPQQSVANSENGKWPESPEQARARLRAEADANRGKPGFRSARIDDGQVVSDGPRRPKFANDSVPPGLDIMEKRRQAEEFEKRRRLQVVGTPDGRRYLSEPPVEYRRTAETAPVGDLGEKESVKERRRKKAAKSDEGFSFKKLVPWLN